MSSLIRLLSIMLIALPNAMHVVTSFSASTKLMQQHDALPSSLRKRSRTRILGSSTVEAPTRPDTDRRTSRDTDDDSNNERRRRSGKRDSNEENHNDDITNDLEYYIDPSASREMNEPFHILLMGSATFIQPKVTVPYVSSTLEYVLGMPHTDAYELSLFARDHDMSCLGTWTREQCLAYGKQLQSRDVICRVVPYCLGGQRGWQAKDASSSFSKSEQS